MAIKCKDCGNSDTFLVHSTISAEAIMDSNFVFSSWSKVDFSNPKHFTDLDYKAVKCVKCNSINVESDMDEDDYEARKIWL